MDIAWVEIGVYAILIGAVIYLAYDNLRSRHRSIKLAHSLIQKELDMKAVQDRLDQVSTQMANLSTSDKDFIKFLSDTREQAFSYIEDAQSMMQVINSDLEDLEKIVSPVATPDMLTKINSISKNIQSLLPK